MFGIDTAINNFLSTLEGLFARVTQFWALKEERGVLGAVELIAKNTATQWVEGVTGDFTKTVTSLGDAAERLKGLTSQVSGHTAVAENSPPASTPTSQPQTPQNSPA
jgi:hypothetical protein